MPNLTPETRLETFLAAASVNGDAPAPAVRIEWFLSAIRSVFDVLGYKTEPSLNLLNPETVKIGVNLDPTNGSEYVDANYVTTDYIAVEPGRKYSVFSEYNGAVIGLPVARIICYDAERGFVSSLGNLAYAGANAAPNTVTVPETGAFLRMVIGKVNYEAFGLPMIMESTGVAMPAAIIPYSLSSGITTPGVWVGKKWAALGDSITERNDKTTVNYCDYINAVTKISVYNMGSSGSGYMRKHASGDCFYDHVAAVPTDCDVVTIFGSLNDLGDSQSLGTVTDGLSDNTILGYVNATIDRLYNLYPAVNIGIISPTPWKSSEPWNISDPASAYCEGLRQICYNRGIPFLDLYHCSNLRPWDAAARDIFYSKDVVDGVNAGCHPDEKGHLMFAPKIKNFLDSLLL